ncbi:hypothetical protein OIU74_025240 [Salix koriyanagi]|uniref:Uncharacterized protein n=1 Tax=Salix koriyanagi TaxID=2511006 RepID=A0A9Q0W0Y0_9ROSI|nr:hypothetical protein OIU74_025240 [Salix koriyanagi]
MHHHFGGEGTLIMEELGSSQSGCHALQQNVESFRMSLILGVVNPSFDQSLLVTKVALPNSLKRLTRASRIINERVRVQEIDGIKENDGKLTLTYVDGNSLYLPLLVA